MIICNCNNMKNHNEKRAAEMPKDAGHSMSRREFMKGLTAFCIAGSMLHESARAETGARETKSGIDPEADAFDTEVQSRVLKRVAEYMYVTLDAKISPPTIMRAEDVPHEELEQKTGMKLEKGQKFNFFYPPNTIFFVSAFGKVHNLAHEMVHYIQFNYKGEEKESADMRLEEQAIGIQDNFR